MQQKIPAPLSGSVSTEYVEPDIGAAAFLMVRGHQLLGLKPAGKGHFGFRFASQGGQAQKDSLAYHAQALCSAHAFAQRLALLKMMESEQVSTFPVRDTSAVTGQVHPFTDLLKKS